MRWASTALPINSTMPSRLRLRKRRPSTASLSLKVSAPSASVAAAGGGPAAAGNAPCCCNMAAWLATASADLPSQPARVPDLGGGGRARAARLIHGAVAPAFHGGEPARHLGHLAGEVGGAARQ